MRYSVAFASEVDSWKWVKRAEALGFHAAWFYDTQLLNPDVFVCMALAAHETSRIRLGTGVLVPTNRICLLYTSPSPRDKRQSRMPSSA